jgi:hypothetical protein
MPLPFTTAGNSPFVSAELSPSASPEPVCAPSPEPGPRRSSCSTQGHVPGPNLWNATDCLRGLAHTVPVQSYAKSSCHCTPVERPSGSLSPVPVPGVYREPTLSIPSNEEEEEASALLTSPQNTTDDIEDNETPIPEVVPVCGCLASALFACCLVSDGVPRSADALIAKGLSCVYETEEHLSFNQAMEHAFAVVASKQSPELVEPKSFKQAMSGPDANKWYEASWS